MFVTGDPQSISLLTSILSVGLEWSDFSEDDHAGDASYQQAMELLISCGYVDAKVEAIVELDGRPGRVRLVYHCHGPCYDLVEEAAMEQSSHVREWADENGIIAGRLTITKRPIALRLSADSINKLRLDRPEMAAYLVKRLRERLDKDEWLSCEPEIALLEVEYHVGGTTLREAEKNIVEAMGDATLFGREIAEKAGYPNNSNFRSTLSHMVKRGILTKSNRGYSVNPAYRVT